MAAKPPGADEARVLITRIRERLEEIRGQAGESIIDTPDRNVEVHVEEPIVRIDRTESWLRGHEQRGWASEGSTELERIVPKLRRADRIVSAWTRSVDGILGEQTESDRGDEIILKQPGVPVVRINIGDLNELTILLGDLPGDDDTNA